MKKLLALALALTMSCVLLAGCSGSGDGDNTGSGQESTQTEDPGSTDDEQAEASPEASAPAGEENTESQEEPTDEGGDAAVMSHEEYIAAELDSEVCVESYVQATQSWWDNKITIYAQSPDGGYFFYNMPCSEEDAAKLVPGTKVRVSGFKSEWEGEVEISGGDEGTDATLEILDDGDTYIAQSTDVTDLLGSDALIDHQNELVSFHGLTVEGVEYKSDPGADDIYLNVSLNGETYQFCVEIYLTDADSDVYKTASELQQGDVVDIEGFLYYYQGVNTHITGITKAS